jgi:hypothetical protein
MVSSTTQLPYLSGKDEMIAQSHGSRSWRVIVLIVLVILGLALLVYLPYYQSQRRYISIPQSIPVENSKQLLPKLPSFYRQAQAPPPAPDSTDGREDGPPPAANTDSSYTNQFLQEAPQVTEVPKHIFAVIDLQKEKMIALAQQTHQQEQEHRHRESIAQQLQQANIRMRRRAIESQSVEAFFNKPPVTLTKEEKVEQARLREVEQAQQFQDYLASLDPVERRQQLQQRQQALEENWRCLHVRSWKGDPKLTPLTQALDVLQQQYSHYIYDLELHPAAIWRVSVLPKLLQGLPTAAAEHKEGPLIWAGCRSENALYFTDLQQLLDHLADRGIQLVTTPAEP